MKKLFQSVLVLSMLSAVVGVELITTLGFGVNH